MQVLFVAEDNTQANESDCLARLRASDVPARPQLWSRVGTDPQLFCTREPATLEMLIVVANFGISSYYPFNLLRFCRLF